MDRKLKVTFVDDQPEIAQSAADQLPKHVQDISNIEVLTLEQVKLEIGILFSRYRAFLDGKSFAQVVAEQPSRLDSVDVLVLDYDLKNTSEGGEWASGLEVARTARAFSTARTIVLLNQFRSTSRFDLTMIEGSVSFADVDVPRVQLSNPGLWQSSGFDGFRPWNWPNLLNEPARFQDLTEWIGKNLDMSVLEVLALNSGIGENDEPARTIPREMWAIAMSEPSWTFRQLIEKSGLVPPQYAPKLMSDVDAAPRVAASIFSHWLERHVVAAQEVFVDAAHLAHLAPWLLLDPMNDQIRGKACALDDSASNVFVESVAAYKVSPSFFSSRSLFRYKDIQEATALARPSDFSFGALPDVVFCEDLSNFVDRKLARPYPSLLPGTYSVRFVCDQEKFRGSWPEVQDPQHVDYAPQSLFAL